jgi:thiosulfate dehydrogenase
MKGLRLSWFPVFLGIIFLAAFYIQTVSDQPGHKTLVNENTDEGWHAPDINLVPQTPDGDMIRYGRELFVNTSIYFGPRGTVATITNGMNCQNCHVWAGTKSNGNNLASVSANYPKYRERSGRVESIEFRINDCMERSLNGKSIDSISKEMRAMVAYMKWLGQAVPPKTKPAGSGLTDIPWLNRAANPEKGKMVYENQCRRCHGKNGEGVFFEDSTRYKYPPLWGPQSFNASAGLYRVSRIVSFIKYNMPFDLAQSSPQLSDEEAWDVAAFICTQTRPEKNYPGDWPKLETKPIDYPFGPYRDHFSEQQHKFGPFIPIKEAIEKEKTALNK